MVDYSALLYDPVYAQIGVPATMVPASTAGEVALTVIDDTRAARTSTSTVGMRSVSTTVLETRSVGPGAFARIPELAANGIGRADYQDAALTFNGQTWTVRSYELRGSPNGEDLGEVRFLLKAAE
jgi:hypothetical protein